MRTVARAGLAGALLLVSLAAPPAQASGAVVLRCTLLYRQGSGPANGNGECDVTGVVNGAAVDGRADVAFNAYTPPEGACVTDTATGTIAGALRVHFTWTRIGTVLLVTTTGDINGFGIGTSATTTQVGGLCGGTVHLVEIFLAGT